MKNLASGVGGSAWGRRVVLLGAAIAGVLATWLVIGGGPASLQATQGHFDFETYSTFESLAADSDAVVVGTSIRPIGKELDEGTDDSKEINEGVPVIFFEVSVDEVLKGQVSDEIVIGAPDESFVSSDSTSALMPNESVLLFLVEQSRKDAPGIDSYDSFFVSLSLDNGVFDVVAKGLVQPRLPDIFAGEEAEVEVGLEAVPAERRQNPTYSLDSIREQVAGQ